jgi:vacuolar-type H+-ATPase subunit H
MPSKDLLEKLFDVEREAEAMVSDALAEAGRRVDAAKTLAQENYTRAYDAALAKALATRERSDKNAREEYERAIADYRRKLEDSSIDRGALNAICDAALEKGR